MEISNLSLSRCEAKEMIEDTRKAVKEYTEKYEKDAKAFLEEWNIVQKCTGNPEIMKYTSLKYVEEVDRDINEKIRIADKKLEKYESEKQRIEKAMNIFKMLFGDGKFVGDENTLPMLRSVKSKKPNNKLVALLIAYVQGKRGRDASGHAEELLADPKIETFSDICKDMRHMYYDTTQIAIIIISLFERRLIGDKKTGEVTKELFETFWEETKRFLVSENLPLTPLHQIRYAYEWKS